jgi:hypothetical protein
LSGFPSELFGISKEPAMMHLLAQDYVDYNGKEPLRKIQTSIEMKAYEEYLQGSVNIPSHLQIVDW